MNLLLYTVNKIMKKDDCYTTIKRLVLGMIAAAISLGFIFSAEVKPAQADYLVRGAKVVNVQNTSSNGENFAIVVQGGTGPCAGKVIIFPASGVSNKGAYDRAYNAALTALSANVNADVYDYSGSSCSNGGQLSITAASGSVK